MKITKELLYKLAQKYVEQQKGDEEMLEKHYQLLLNIFDYEKDKR